MNDGVLICRERYGSQAITRHYIRTSAGVLEAVADSQKLTSFSQFFRSVFLPVGYPESVSPDYTEYQIWDTIQAFCSGVTGTLATQAVLKGVGVGDETATVLAATMTWLLKSGTGMVGQIMFTWIQGTALDSDCKRWRLFADILNDAAIFMDIIAPHFLAYFTPIVCVAGVFRSLVGVAGGATRATLTQHQARRNNMADVSAKDGSQETLVNLIALIGNLILVPLVTGKHMVIWVLYLIFTSFHLFANYNAVKCVAMETFNQARMHIVTQFYLSSPDGSMQRVKEANRQEPVIWKIRRTLNIKLGVSMSELLHSYDDFQKLSTIYYGSKYILGVDLKERNVHVVLHRDAIVYDQLQACFQAEVLEFALHHTTTPLHQREPLRGNTHLHNVLESARHGDVLSMLSHSHKLAIVAFPAFLSAAERAGWTTAHALLSSGEWRAVWDAHGVDGREEITKND